MIAAIKYIQSKLASNKTINVNFIRRKAFYDKRFLVSLQASISKDFSNGNKRTFLPNTYQDLCMTYRMSVKSSKMRGDTHRLIICELFKHLK